MPIFRLIIVLLIGVILYPISFLVLGNTFGEVIFYRGIVHALLIFAIQFLLGVGILSGGKGSSLLPTPAFRRFFSFSLAALALSFNLTFLIVFPVTFDRSVTTYLLEELAHKKSLSAEQMQSLLINDYVIDKKAVLRRMREQELSGNVVGQGDLYALTAQGERFIWVSRGVRWLFGIAPHREGAVLAVGKPEM
jgi:hypothetical protein